MKTSIIWAMYSENLDYDDMDTFTADKLRYINYINT
jgi:5-keto 4-deoxyuronate isomerase